MVQRIIDLMNERQITSVKITSELGLSNSAISEWKKGKAKPSADAIIKIAQYFNVTADYLLGLSAVPTAVPQEYTSDEVQLLGDYQSLTQQGKEFIRQTMVAALNTYKKQVGVSDMETSSEIAL